MSNAYFRIRKNIKRKNGEFIEAGQITQLSDIDDDMIETLIEVRAINRVYTPEIDIVSELNDKSDVLKNHDIIYLNDFLEADNEMLADILEVDVASIEADKKSLVKKYLMVNRKKDCGC